jgi:nicotinamide-nucleotide adenylyltransferase
MVGRFQPFHIGHLALARQILGECDELVIAIGSAQFNFIEKDPFTAGERVVMIHGALAGATLNSQEPT